MAFQPRTSPSVSKCATYLCIIYLHTIKVNRAGFFPAWLRGSLTFKWDVSNVNNVLWWRKLKYWAQSDSTHINFTALLSKTEAERFPWKIDPRLSSLDVVHQTTEQQCWAFRWYVMAVGAVADPCTGSWGFVGGRTQREGGLIHWFVTVQGEIQTDHFETHFLTLAAYETLNELSVTSGWEANTMQTRPLKQCKSYFSTVCPL